MAGEAKQQTSEAPSGSMCRVTREIEDNPSIQIGNHQLSHLANVPLRDFRREFRRNSGMTPYQYLLKVRAMQAASIIISEPEADLKEMAKRLGFSNVGALMRKFKREHGCTIEEYRATNFAKSRAGRPKS